MSPTSYRAAPPRGDSVYHTRVTTICQPDPARRRRRVHLLLLVLACIGAVLLGAGGRRGRSSGAEAPEAPFEFVLMGDTPYSRIEEMLFEPMLAEIGRGDFAFVVHVGDFKSGSSRCSDEL